MTKKIVICCGDAPNQRALAAKIAKQYPVEGIVIEKRKPVIAKQNYLKIFSKVYDRLKFASIYKAWKNLQRYYANKFTAWPEVQLLNSDSINNKETEEFILRLSPDLIVISGTSLIKQPLLSIPVSIGMINLHTGLSPYVKGGPNCTNWCIANNDWHMVGNTIMWINAGIDSGNIITTETVDIRTAPDLFGAQKIVMEHAHDLYLRAIQYLLNNKPPFISIEQSSFKAGKLFYTKMWTAEKRSALLRNWRKRKRAILQESPKTISLPLN